MKTIALVMQSLLPMPPVRGGAIETLVNGLLLENEKVGRYSFTVVGPWDAEAERAAEGYRHAEFVYIKGQKRPDAVRSFARHVGDKLAGRVFQPDALFLARMCRALAGRRFDAVVVEGRSAYLPALSALGIGPLCLHAHNAPEPTECAVGARVSPLCSRFISVSGFIERELVERMSADPARCSVLLNCIDIVRFQASMPKEERTALRGRHGIGANDVVFIYCGRICVGKGVRELAEAFSRLLLPNARLMIVGSRWFGKTAGDAYQREVEAILSPCREQVIFTGFVPYDQMPMYYAMSDVAVLPSVLPEASLLSALEAQAAGLPVIATRNGGVPENVSPEGALLLPLGDCLSERLLQAMEALASDARMRGDLGAAGCAFSQGRNFETYFAGFSRIIDGFGE